MHLSGQQGSCKTVSDSNFLISECKSFRKSGLEPHVEQGMTRSHLDLRRTHSVHDSVGRGRFVPFLPPALRFGGHLPSLSVEGPGVLWHEDD